MNKTFSYEWCSDYFLLHAQLTNSLALSFDVVITRDFCEKGKKIETVSVKGDTSYRFMITRKHPKERGFTLDYPEDVTLEAFKLDDRAYYPTQSFFKG
jgi:hypothetical protein